MEQEQGYDAATFGDQVADVYDRMYGPDDEAVACLADLAGDGPVLELGIGTGRLALPLAARGLDVEGIDASAAMAAKLEAKPGGDRIPVTIGNFEEVGVQRDFSLVFVAFNTFFVLLTRGAQQRCFENVVRHLTPNGRFALGAFIPDTSRYVRDQHLEVQEVRVDGARLSASRHDREHQRVDSLIMWISNEGIRTWPARLRYSYPAELDEMAARAGLRLEHRWSSWARESFDDDSAYAVSVYERE